MLKGFENCVVDALIEELKVLSTVIKHMFDDIAQEFFCERTVAIEVAESHLRLNHPELSQVTRSIGIFSPECWSKCVDIRKCRSKDFCFELTRHGEVGWLTEEIL